VSLRGERHGLRLIVGFRVGVDPWSFTSALPDSLISQKSLGNLQSERRLALDLRAKPDAELENVLELLCGVVPAVVVAKSVSWQVVVCRVTAAAAVRKDMVGLPSAVNRSAANVTPAASLVEDSATLCCRKRLASAIFNAEVLLALTAQKPQFMQQVRKHLWVRCG